MPTDNTRFRFCRAPMTFVSPPMDSRGTRKVATVWPLRARGRMSASRAWAGSQVACWTRPALRLPGRTFWHKVTDGPPGPPRTRSGSYSTLGLPAGTYTITARAAGFTGAGTASGLLVVNGSDTTADVTLSDVAVSLSGSPRNLVQSQTAQFTATVIGAADQRVTWSLSPAVGTISSTGLYTAPATISAPAEVTITATSVAAAGRSAAMTVSVANLFTLALAPVSVVGGAPTSSNTVTLDSPAPAGGAVIALSSSDPSLAAVPSSITVAEGASVSPFTIITSYVAASTAIQIMATYQGSTKCLNLTLQPAALYSLYLSPASVSGGSTTLEPYLPGRTCWTVGSDRLRDDCGRNARVRSGLGTDPIRRDVFTLLHHHEFSRGCLHPGDLDGLVCGREQAGHPDVEPHRCVGPLRSLRRPWPAAPLPRRIGCT